MNKFVLVVALLLVPAWPASATFSIVGINPITGDLGIALRVTVPGMRTPTAAASPLIT